MARICPFCSEELPQDLQGVLEAFYKKCPSGCDAKHLVSISCPSCERVFWKKWVKTRYKEIQHKNVKFVSQEELEHPTSNVDWGEGDWEIDDGNLIFLGDRDLIDHLVIAEPQSD